LKEVAYGQAHIPLGTLPVDLDPLEPDVLLGQRGGEQGEAALLASCYRSCLLLAEAHSIRTLDFCSISTGVYGYPLPLAATVALRAIMDFLADHALPERVRMVCHSEQAAEVYRRTWNLWYAEGKDQRM